MGLTRLPTVTHALFPHDHGLGPNLVDLVLKTVELALVASTLYGHNPVAALTRVVAEECTFVTGAGEDTDTGIGLGSVGVGGTVAVGGGRDEVLHGRLLATLDAVQLAQLNDPYILQQLGGLLIHVRSAEAVGEVTLGQQTQELGLTDALLTGGDEDLVELVPGADDSVHGGDEPQLGDFAVELVVLRAEPPDERGLHAGCAVPDQTIEVALDRVVAVLQCHDLQGVLEQAVHCSTRLVAELLEVGKEVRALLVDVPHAVSALGLLLVLDNRVEAVLLTGSSLFLPRQVTLHGDVVGHGVVAELAFEVGVVAQIENSVVQCRLELTRLGVDDQFLFPVRAV